MKAIILSLLIAASSIAAFTTESNAQAACRTFWNGGGYTTICN